MESELLVPIPPGFDPEGLRLYRASGEPLARMGLAIALYVLEGEEGRPLWFLPRYGGETWEYADKLRLSVGDVATRDRCARWVAERLGWAGDGGYPTAVTVGRRFFGNPAPVFGLARIDVQEGPLWRSFEHIESPALMAALDALDPTEDTRLPDGSRLVDALALAAVVRHLAEVSRG